MDHKKKKLQMDVSGPFTKARKPFIIKTRFLGFRIPQLKSHCPRGSTYHDQYIHIFKMFFDPLYIFNQMKFRSNADQ